MFNPTFKDPYARWTMGVVFGCLAALMLYSHIYIEQISCECFDRVAYPDVEEKD